MVNLRKTKARIRISTSVSKTQNLIVSLLDNGHGIQYQNMGKLLELFFTTKRTRGTGLGLPIVLKFVEKIGGNWPFVDGHDLMHTRYGQLDAQTHEQSAGGLFQDSSQ